MGDFDEYVKEQQQESTGGHKWQSAVVIIPCVCFILFVTIVECFSGPKYPIENNRGEEAINTEQQEK